MSRQRSLAPFAPATFRFLCFLGFGFAFWFRLALGFGFPLRSRLFGRFRFGSRSGLSRSRGFGRILVAIFALNGYFLDFYGSLVRLFGAFAFIFFIERQLVIFFVMKFSVKHTTLPN